MTHRREITTLELTVSESASRAPRFLRRFWVFDLRLLQHLHRFAENLYLLHALVVRGIRARYKQSIIGVGWALVTPAAMTAVFTYIFSRTRLVGEINFPCPLPIYILFAMTFWTFFQKAVTNGSTALVTNMDLVTKVYFPREVLPVASVLMNLVDWALAFVMFLIFATAYSVLIPALARHFPFMADFAYTGEYLLVPHLRWLWLPVFLAALLLFISGLVFIVSTLQVYFRDMTHLVNLALFLWLFMTPIVYPLRALAGGRATTLIIMNPLTGLIDGLQLSFLQNKPPLENHVLYALCFSAGLFLVGYSFFKHEERYFADVV